MARRENPPYLVANSNMAFRTGKDQYNLRETALYAARVGADGTQLHTTQVGEGHIAPTEIYDLLGELQLTKNVVHVGGVLTPESFGGNGIGMLRNASRMIPPIPDLGIVGIIHHDSGSPTAAERIAEMTEAVMEQVNNPHVVLGLECVVNATNGPLDDQVQKYIDVLGSLLDRELPVIPVLDVRNLHDMSGGKQLEDPDDRNLIRLFVASRDQKAIMHARDVHDIPTSWTPGNFVPIGTGAFTDLHRKVVELGRRNNIDWRGMVDENQEPVLTSRQDIDETFQRLFGQKK